jgi:hypothetical protein
VLCEKVGNKRGNYDKILFRFKATLTKLPDWMASNDGADGKRKDLLSFTKSTGICNGIEVAVKMLCPEKASKEHRLNFLNEIEIVSEAYP